ncbi:selenocysteine-specific translation elongation factor SelB [Cricetibacter osteomyelitidis]|uniref:Selenocysteine-specific elongation factor n=1 Tax=Cricetibacter osteomyelitidis TaxID=1521931 RepID=A0A4V2T1D0_9PAST|nr:selenocysteine-specific translation elongation factor [Cricetibacter osteomyelitidis]TCP93213.1 selenocysteine-specific translation elongation factor SelB [Cricetibacter osteomyelitidis]
MIIVTSGHVDHGKTALLQALTGTNTAHLPEEKKRGMTIDLGYAYLPLADKILGFIDVPGHEKFLANMLAGLGGIEHAMLIVAADEGIQPQTVEHLTILRLLQIRNIMVIITKSDRASSQQIDELKAKIQQNYPFLTDNPFFVTSATSGQGIDKLRDYLAALSNHADQNKPFRYAIDRIFSVTGAGTVVTGTAFSGTVKIDDELYLSGSEKVRVKNIHAQNTQSVQGFAGQRLALNITDSDRSSVDRGDWLLSSPPFAATERLTIRLEAETNLTESQPVHIYQAASRTTGKLSLLDNKSLAKSQQGLAELLLDKPLFLTFGDKLILRSGDAKSVIAGASVLEVYSPKRHKRSEVRLNYLQNLQQAENTAQRIALYLQGKAVNVQELAWIEQLTEAQLNTVLAQNKQVRFQDWAFDADYQQQQNEKLITALSDYHEQYSDQLGLGKARLYRIACLNQPEKLIYHFIDELIAKNRLQQTRGWLHTPEHKIQFNEQERELWKQVLQQFAENNGQSLWVRDVANALRVDETAMRNFMYKAGKLGYLTAVVKDRFFLTEMVYGYARLIKKIAKEQGSISVNQLRDELNFGRKMTVQLMEYFDRCGFLRRKGNQHILRDSEMFDL